MDNSVFTLRQICNAHFRFQRFLAIKLGGRGGALISSVSVYLGCMIFSKIMRNGNMKIMTRNFKSDFLNHYCTDHLTSGIINFSFVHLNKTERLGDVCIYFY